MMSQTMACLSTVLATCVALGGSVPPLKAIPEDFRVVAEYTPGSVSSAPWAATPWNAWTLTITADGRAIQEIELSRQERVRKSVTLSQPALRRLVDAVEASGFQLLAEKYSADIFDSVTLVLGVTMNGRHHEVVVNAAHHLKDQSEVIAFLRLWNTIVETVPPPNPGQGVEKLD